MSSLVQSHIIDYEFASVNTASDSLLQNPEEGTKSAKALALWFQLNSVGIFGALATILTCKRHCYDMLLHFKTQVHVHVYVELDVLVYAHVYIHFHVHEHVQVQYMFMYM